MGSVGARFNPNYPSRGLRQELQRAQIMRNQKRLDFLFGVSEPPKVDPWKSRMTERVYYPLKLEENDITPEWVIENIRKKQESFKETLAKSIRQQHEDYLQNVRNEFDKSKTKGRLISLGDVQNKNHQGLTIKDSEQDMVEETVVVRTEWKPQAEVKLRDPVSSPQDDSAVQSERKAKDPEQPEDPNDRMVGNEPIPTGKQKSEKTSMWKRFRSSFRSIKHKKKKDS